MGVNINKKKLDCIKEVFYACGTHPELDLLLLDHYHPFDDFWRDYNYAWLVYLDLPKNKQVICLSLSNTNGRDNLPQIKFNERLSSLKGLDFNSLLYICTLYQQISNPTLASKIFAHYKGGYSNLKAFTTYSYGRIIYKHQAAFLYGLLTGCTVNEGVKWVDDMNKRNAESIKIAKTIIVLKDKSLYDVWQNLTFDGFVKKANWDGAKKLLQHLTS